MQRTLHIPLSLSSADLSLLKTTQQVYKEAYDTHAQWYHTNKTHNKLKAHTALYTTLRHKHPNLPSALLQSARDNASESIKSYNSRYPKKRWSKTPTLGKTMTIRLNKRSASLRGNLFTFSTVGERIRILITLPDFWQKRYPDWKFQAATVGINKHGTPFANLTFVSPSDTKYRLEGKVVGLDRGIHKLVVTSEGGEFGGKEVRAKRRQHLFTRKTLQAKGTRSAKRRLRQQAGREKRYSQQVNHRVSKMLAQDSSVKVYVLEDLSNLARKKLPKWQRHSNKRVSDWSHAQLLFFLRYKCEAAGIELVFVNPAFTSQTCSQCGWVDGTARVKGWYSCGKCGYRDDADFNAAVNIKAKFLAISPQDKPGAGSSEGAVCSLATV